MTFRRRPKQATRTGPERSQSAGAGRLRVVLHEQAAAYVLSPRGGAASSSSEPGAMSPGLIEGLDAVSALDSRPDLMDLTPDEFEHLVGQVFEATGLEGWTTEHSKDDGVDAVMVNIV